MDIAIGAGVVATIICMYIAFMFEVLEKSIKKYIDMKFKHSMEMEKVHADGINDMLKIILKYV